MVSMAKEADIIIFDTEMKRMIKREVTLEFKYGTRFDNVNLEEIFRSERLLKNYVNCLLEKGPCTPEATELKRVLPDALSSECLKCSKKQREGGIKVSNYLIENKPDVWKELESRYDPQGSYLKNYRQKKAKNGTKNSTSESSKQ